MSKEKNKSQDVKKSSGSVKLKASTWVIASGNRGKIREFQSLFSDSGIVIIAQSELEVVEAEETGLSFIENAIIKARNASAQTKLPAIADDSGLEVSALYGEPGIYSARYAADSTGAETSDQRNNEKLLSALEGVQSRGARFVCSLAFVRHAHDPTPVVSVGYWQGKILAEPRGEKGFGYDPLFYLDDQECTAAELEPKQKAKISHRGQAMSKLFKNLQDEKII